MELFNLYDISAIVHTKSAERIISPMVTELYHLIIAIELGDVHYEALAGLEETANELEKATEQLACIARRLAEQSDDEVLKQEMKLAAKSLLIAGKSFLLVVQKLLIQPDVENGIEELVISAKRILAETLKVLQTENDVMFGRVIQAAHRLLDRLFSLESTEKISAMRVAFHNFSEALLLLTSLTERLLGELKVSPHQKHLTQTLQMLKKCIPMLYSAKFSHLKYPSDQQVKLSKTYIFDLVENIVEELISLLKYDVGKKNNRGQNGLFPRHLHKLLRLLSRPQPIDLCEGKFDVLVAVVVFYCMLLADFSRATIKGKLVKLCHHLLILRKAIAMGVRTKEGFPVESQLEKSIKEKCCSMRGELENLNQAVQTAVLYQILDNFAEPKEPMKRLVEAAAEPGFQARKGGVLKELQPLITAFFCHSIQMLKAVNFVLVTCTKMETIEELEDCVHHLSKLLATVPVLLSKMSHNPDNEDVPEKLYSLCQVWSSTIECLLMCFDKVIDLREFLDLSVQEMVGHKECSEKALVDQHSGEFSWHASSLSKQATQVVEFVTRHVDRARDPIFRNGLLVLIRQLENAILLVKMAMDQCVAGSSSPQAKNTYSRRAKRLIESTCNVRKGLDECNQPDILSPLRETVRNLDISKHPICVSPQDSLELSSQNTLKQSTTDHSEVLGGFSDTTYPVLSFSQKVSEGSGLCAKDEARKTDLNPLISELLKATKSHNIAKLNGACSDLLELSTCCVDAVEEALQLANSPVLEKLLHYREIGALTSHLISLAEEVSPNSICSSERLLQMADSLSKRIHEAKQSLTIVASSWYSLSKQLFCIVSPCDFIHNSQTMDEIMQMLGTVVQLAGKATFLNHDEELPVSSGICESFLKMQTKFTCVQARTKHLLEKVLPGVNTPSDVGKLESFDGNCILWSITIHTFLDVVDQFIGRDVLSLNELKTKLKYQVCMQSTMETISKSSLRLQNVAKLSFPLCAEHGLEDEMVVLREQMQILTESLLQVADVLSVSPLPTANLSVRFELLQRELAITAKVLLLRLSRIHRVYLNSIQSVIRLAQPVTHDNKCDGHKNNQEVFEKNAGQLMANVQMVKKIIGDAFENPASFKVKENLISTVNHLLFLTDKAIWRAGKLQSELDKEHLLEDDLLHEWSSEAGYLVTQLQSTKGISRTALDIIGRCLQNEGEHIHSSQTVCNSQSSPHREVDSGNHQNPAALSQRPMKTGQKASLIRDINKMPPRSDLQSGNQLHHSDGGLTASPTASSGDSEKWWHDDCPVSQVAKQMTTQMSYMAQFLKRKGPITTKEQLIASAAQIISGGQALLKFSGIVAKNCLDKRCATELQYAIQQAKTISYQLSIISRVNASTGKSRLSAEHLVSNAQNLIQAVFQILKVTEAACFTGLQQLPPDSEEADVAAFCIQWRKRLWQHRIKAASSSDRDELGLRKAKTEARDPNLHLRLLVWIHLTIGSIFLARPLSKYFENHSRFVKCLPHGNIVCD
ncbi:uncharacterized protein LOC125424816 [Sphaerodactylus townsendi]|uniref:uncharacterized protein LOC125424816 n=1 Tax=Sphaerodactylus townsendi TaxID=933632 RepID=UPI0020260264|nr:uncharacterized protein LOC125424816 [Sphaerodactylus townsendi]XP_048338211.1 uncharacterized protein LOC125424816 [Sphaerodactylus townsendi]XP_048338217.1 uncharacterized protein LOC125424816 [Sphaerodactylus townsendi]XP_048338224.1 uncharacterized protein LOC125424816 [Sphaerodactylus townsendi]